MTSFAEDASINRMIFINLPVADLERSRRFYAGLGFAVDPQLSDGQCVCVVISRSICVMLLGHDRFAQAIDGEIADAHRTTEVLNCLTAASRDEVDRLVTRAVLGGGRVWRDKVDDGVMYGHSFADPDGHVWELLHLEFGSGP
ncbi:VOC family protein [Microlunatus speluncae]|uniref:VOC family protein n=1 Tax=Microlunatus speluncae TaxID=2594267 RepID=UPI001478785F|nr:VOC family protein [Microlunatus speluncae]